MNTTPIDHKIEFMAWNGEEIIKDFVTFKLRFGYTVNQKMNCGAIAVMQLTALRSINNEPIYNHMIVKCLWGRHLVIDMFDYKLMAYLSERELEIVGNRFQSPKLLELCK